MKRALIAIAAVLTVFSVSASAAKPTKEEFVDHLENHFKLYGFIRNYFAFDTRESSAGTGDLYYYMPKDVNYDGLGTERENDRNAVCSFRFLSLTSRVGLDVTGYEISGYKLGAKFEADFYAGLSGTTGTAQLRLRQAYATIAKGGRAWKIGQAWHPMAADLPDIFSLESGVPFGPFSRTPQVTLDWTLAKDFYITLSAIWQMQYTSTGPSLEKDAASGTYKYVGAASANYIKYSCTPEVYLGLNYKNGGNIVRVGAEVLSIKPRNYDYDMTTGKALGKVKDRITTWNVFEYGQVTAGSFVLKEKVTYANDGSHFNMVGGYGVSELAADNADGIQQYSATRNISGWLTAAYKKKDCRWSPSILVGYNKNLGTSEEVYKSLFWFKNSATTLNQMYRIQPELLYNLGKLSFGLEYMMTSCQYGKTVENGLSGKTDMKVTGDLHWVYNHRVQMMVKFTF